MKEPRGAGQSDRHHGLGHTQGAELAAVEYDARRLLCGRPERCHRQTGPPEIMNTDQGSQFTGSAWITTLTGARVRISMDGRGCYLDNTFIERL